jgi:hypothetical protein
VNEDTEDSPSEKNILGVVLLPIRDLGGDAAFLSICSGKFAG